MNVTGIMLKVMTARVGKIVPSVNVPYWSGRNGESVIRETFPSRPILQAFEFAVNCGPWTER